ncbi:hypothetical protein [Rhodococcus tukisamuensis]|uniref:hypothetical protein n=1 Tax=Rhodococcus tukisamuensis TaxID=168276 RepID=UPI001113E672|nr:hypothetical protein [Rhodococcus tukisamuensis]
MLAALAIGVGVATMGAGAAWGVSSSAVGGVDQGCAGLEQPCDTSFWSPSERVGNSNIYLGYQGPGEAEVGREVGYFPSFSAPDGMPGLAVTSVTHHAPRGFEFVGAEVSSRTPPWWTDVNLDSTATVDPVTGDVTVTAPEGGWVIPTDGFRSGQLYVYLRYKVVKPYLAGTAGVTFTGTDVPASKGWMATGITREVSAFGPFGS